MTQPQNRSGKLPNSLATYLMSMNIGDQILTVRELAETYDVSLGSVSSVINQFEEIGAISISRRGHLGSYLEEKSLAVLWKLIGVFPMVIGLTLPSFKRCEGLATAIYTLLNEAGIDVYMTFIRGSINRIDTLRSGLCHAVVMSQLAADELIKDDEEIIIRLPPESFVDEHRLFYRGSSESLSRKWRVGVDPESLDISYLTNLEFENKDIELINMTFTQIDLHLEDSPIDAAISTLDFMERLSSKGIKSKELSSRVQAIVADRSTSAVFVTGAQHESTKIVLKELLKPDKILAVQQSVMNGITIPRY